MSRPPARRRATADPSGEELVVCVGGHRDGQWHTAEAWTRELACARFAADIQRRIGAADPEGHLSARALRYRETGRVLEHPATHLHGPGRVLEWTRRPVDE